MSRYQPAFEDRFVRNQRRYRSLQKQIQRRVDQALDVWRNAARMEECITCVHGGILLSHCLVL